MGKLKLKNEKSTIISFIVVSMLIFILSFIFLVVSLGKEELGGTLLCCMLAFISAYATIVFIGRIIRYSRITKIQTCILDDNMASLEQISQNIKFGVKTIKKDIKFMIDCGYLSGYKLYEDKIVNVEQEKQKLEEIRKQTLLSMANANTNKTTQQNKKRITSDKCPNCGAAVTFVSGEADCPYCGNSLNEE